MHGGVQSLVQFVPGLEIVRQAKPFAGRGVNLRRLIYIPLHCGNHPAQGR